MLMVCLRSILLFLSFIFVGFVDGFQRGTRGISMNSDVKNIVGLNRNELIPNKRYIVSNNNSVSFKTEHVVEKCNLTRGFNTNKNSIDTSRVRTLPLKEGSEVPSVNWPYYVDASKDSSSSEKKKSGWNELKSTDIFGGKRVIIFSLPGAFTPTCSSKHLPDFEQFYDQIREHNIDEIYCLSVNDTFVMNAWKKGQKIRKVHMIPDGHGEFSNKMGLMVEKSNIGFGHRSWRYSMIVNNHIIEKIFIESGLADNITEDPFTVSSAQYMLQYLQSQ